MHFDLADLKVLVHLAEAENLTRGARRAALSPAAVSSRLKGLESQLGTQLFYREARGLTLTSTGERFLHHARLILRQADVAREDLLGLADGTTGHVRVCASTTTISEVLPAVLAEFMGARPDVTVDLQQYSLREVIRAVTDGAADLGLIAEPVPLKGVHATTFSVDRLVVVAHSAHALAKRGELRFEETLAYPYVGLLGSTLQQFLLDTAAQAGRPMTVRVMMTSFDAMCRMAEAGVGLCIVPRSTAKRLAKTMRVNVLTITDAWSVRERRVIYREFDALPACAKKLLELLVERSGESGTA
jgi:DNA-binding transcriptional LysR family regulator